MILWAKEKMFFVSGCCHVILVSIKMYVCVKVHVHRNRNFYLLHSSHQRILFIFQLPVQQMSRMNAHGLISEYNSFALNWVYPHECSLKFWAHLGRLWTEKTIWNPRMKNIYISMHVHLWFASCSRNTLSILFRITGPRWLSGMSPNLFPLHSWIWVIISHNFFSFF